MVSKLRLVPVNLIDQNPHRDLATYPWLTHKVDALVDSINKAGFWEGVIARPKGSRYQLAFGHHRLEAARQLELKQVPLIIRSLTDEEMLTFMALENGEDFHTQFYVALNTWEAAVTFVNSTSEKLSETVTNVARTIGWMVRSGKAPSRLAYMCADALELIHQGYLDRSSFMGLTPNQAHKTILGARDLARRKIDPERVKTATVQVNRNILAGTMPANIADDAVREHATTVLTHTPKELLEKPPGRKAKPSKIRSFSENMVRSWKLMQRLLKNDPVGKFLVELSKNPHRVWDDDAVLLNNICLELGRIATDAQTYIAQIERGKQKQHEAVVNATPVSDEVIVELEDKPKRAKRAAVRKHK